MTTQGITASPDLATFCAAMRTARRLMALGLLAVLTAGLSLPAEAKRQSKRTTFLLARSFDGHFPNGPSRNGAISHDQRVARYMAFESDASDLVQRDSNGLTDIFLVRRKPPWASNGTPWVPGSTEIVSIAPDGAPANGRSYRPAVDGDAHHKPTLCRVHLRRDQPRRGRHQRQAGRLRA